jgi:hypothetical protein
MNIITTLTPHLLHLVICLTILLTTLVLLRKNNTVKKLEQNQEESLNAIIFLLCNEDKHCEEHKEIQGKSLRNTMRDRVVNENGLKWNSKHSKSGCAKALEQLKKKKSKDQTFVIEFFKGLLLKAVK